jgi:hemolysin activation/secretion protein
MKASWVGRPIRVLSVQGRPLGFPIGVACLAGLAALAAPGDAFAIGNLGLGGGFQSTDRPSEFRPELPAFERQETPESFTLPPVPEAPGKPDGASPLVHIQHIVIEGNTALPPAKLRTMVQPYENRDVSVAELEELRQKITKLYMDEGYINSGAIIGDNALENGVLTYTIVEGRLSEVRVKGHGNLREGYIANRLQGDPDRPLNIRELEDRFQLLLSDPLISKMNGRILPGASPGQGILDVEVSRARPYHFALFGDNYRPPSVGPNAFGLFGSLLSPLGFGEILDFTFSTSAGTHRYAGGLTVPLNDSGTLAFFRFDEGDSVVVEAPFQNLDIQSEVHNLEGGVSHLIINTLRQRLNLGILLATRENDTSVLGRPFSFVAGVPGGHTQATVWRLYQDYVQRWERHALAARSTFSVGMNALGATPEKGDYPGSQFFAWLGQAQYAYRVDDDGTQLVLRGNVQVANAPLLPLEKIAVGGINTVRGYRTNYLVRDNGYNVNAELHYPLHRYELWGTPGWFELVPFMDYGEAWNLKTTWDPYAKSTALWSIGAGVHWNHQPLFAEIYYGYALNKPFRPKGDALDDLQDNGLFFDVRFDVF